MGEIAYNMFVVEYTIEECYQGIVYGRIHYAGLTGEGQVLK